ncbi:MAG: serine/threonine protein kinase [Lentisphaeria bacterium]|nr:serine/threonine protein kinase [Lentisphaeria bacterium]NQZ70443.1 serine/threonine protein kinase [Lentisphaeria bacterium]
MSEKPEDQDPFEFDQLESTMDDQRENTLDQMGNTMDDFDSSNVEVDLDSLDQTMSDQDDYMLADRYMMIRKLGQGGMGAVYLAEDSKLNNMQVAIKMLPAYLSQNQNALDKLKKEAATARQLTHTNIITQRGFDEAGGHSFLVMDYIKGDTLENYLAEQKTLAEDEIINLFTPIAEALDYAHQRGVIHRDIKPSNIMITEQGQPLLMDFGISLDIKDLENHSGISGTLPYMSPEQVNAEMPTASQDIYSLAASIYECLAAHPPFQRGDIRYQILNQKVAKIKSPFNGPLQQALSKEPEKRPKTCSQLLLDLQAAKKSKTMRYCIRAGLVFILLGIGGLELNALLTKDEKITESLPGAYTEHAGNIEETQTGTEPKVVIDRNLIERMGEGYKPGVGRNYGKVEILVSTDGLSKLKHYEKRGLLSRVVYIMNNNKAGHYKIYDAITDAMKNKNMTTAEFNAMEKKIKNKTKFYYLKLRYLKAQSDYSKRPKMKSIRAAVLSNCEKLVKSYENGQKAKGFRLDNIYRTMTTLYREQKNHDMALKFQLKVLGSDARKYENTPRPKGKLSAHKTNGKFTYSYSSCIKQASYNLAAGKPEKALFWGEEAYAQAPDKATRNAAYAGLLHKLKHYKKAGDHYLKESKIAKNMYISQYRQEAAMAYWDGKYYSEAKAVLEKHMKDPRFKKTRASTVRLLKKIKTDEARNK